MMLPLLILIKKQAATLALFVVLLMFCPLFVKAQTAEIEAAETELNEARKDTLHPKRYAEAIINTNKANDTYLRSCPFFEEISNSFYRMKKLDSRWLKNSEEFIYLLDSLGTEKLDMSAAHLANKIAEKELKNNLLVFLFMMQDKYQRRNNYENALYFSSRMYQLLSPMHSATCDEFGYYVVNRYFNNYIVELSLNKRIEEANIVTQQYINKIHVCVNELANRSDSSSIKRTNKLIDESIRFHTILSWNYIAINKPDSATYNAQMAYNLSRRYKVLLNDAKIPAQLVKLLSLQGDFDSAFAVVKVALEEYQNMPSQYVDVIIQYSYGLYIKGDYRNACEKIKEAQMLVLKIPNYDRKTLDEILVGILPVCNSEEGTKKQIEESNKNSTAKGYNFSILAKVNEFYNNGDILNTMKAIEEALYKFSQLDKRETSESQEAALLDAFALILSDMGLYSEAIRYGKQAFELKQRFLSKKSPFLGEAYVRMALLHLRFQDFKVSKYYFDIGINMMGKFLESNPHKSFDIYGVGAMLAEKNEDYRLADTLYRLSIGKEENWAFLPANANAKAGRKALFAENLRRLGRLEEARQELNSAYKYQGSLLIADLLIVDVLLSESEGNAHLIDNIVKNYMRGTNEMFNRHFSVLSDGDKTQFIISFKEQLDALTSVLSRNTEGGKYLYDLALLQKGIALSDTRNFQQKLNQLPEGDVKNVAGQLSNKMKLLNNDTITLDIRIQFNREADSLRTLLKNDKEGKKLFTTDWIETSYVDIQKRLKPNEVSVEFIDFKYHTTTVPTDSTFYYALVLHDKGLPKMIKMCEEKELANVLTNDVYKINNCYDVKNKQLTKLLWQSLEDAKILRGGETIYYAPSGLLHRVAFAALPNLTDTFRLSDRYNLVQMNSTRDIGTQTEWVLDTATTSAAFFGNITYASDSATIVRKNSQFIANPPQYQLKSYISDGVSNCLIRPIGFDEAKPLHTAFEKRKIKTFLFETSAASEDAFRSFGTKEIPAPTLLLISTHGKYDAVSDRLTPQQSLHYNYLFMAGCERQLCYKKPPINGMQDGILTAAEIAQMNLSATQLVVLSACQTGLGDIKGREGVYGLSRAFKLAGARYTLSSLWSVPDAESAEFMEVFYAQLLDNQTIPNAFAKTQVAMRKKYAANTSAWAAWVLMR